MTEADWEKLNYNLLLEPWDNVNKMGAEELQNRITTNIENAIRMTAELKKKPKKPKPPRIVRKCMRTKRKISKRINNLNRNISYDKICKLREKIRRAEELQERFFKEAKEKEEREAWSKMKKIK